MNDRVDSLASNREKSDNVENNDSNHLVSGRGDAAGGDFLVVGGLLAATKHLNQRNVAADFFIGKSPENETVDHSENKTYNQFSPLVASDSSSQSSFLP